MRVLKVIAAWLAAVAATTALGSVVQTQFNLAELQALGVPVPAAVRLHTTGLDLAGFGPPFAALVAIGFMVAFLVTALLRRWLTRGRGALYALAGAAAVSAMLAIMIVLFELVPIAAARGATGFTALALCGATGGWLFARLSAPGSGAGGRS